MSYSARHTHTHTLTMNHCFFFFHSLDSFAVVTDGCCFWSFNSRVYFSFIWIPFRIEKKVLFSFELTRQWQSELSLSDICRIYIQIYRSTESATTKIDESRKLKENIWRFVAKWIRGCRFFNNSTFSLLEAIQHRRLVTNQLHQNNCNNWQFINDDDVRAACTFFFLVFPLHASHSLSIYGSLCSWDRSFFSSSSSSLCSLDIEIIIIIVYSFSGK